MVETVVYLIEEYQYQLTYDSLAVARVIVRVGIQRNAASSADVR